MPIPVALPLAPSAAASASVVLRGLVRYGPTLLRAVDTFRSPPQLGPAVAAPNKRQTLAELQADAIAGALLGVGSQPSPQLPGGPNGEWLRALLTGALGGRAVVASLRQLSQWVGLVNGPARLPSASAAPSWTFGSQGTATIAVRFRTSVIGRTFCSGGQPAGDSVGSWSDFAFYAENLSSLSGGASVQEVQKLCGTGNGSWAGETWFTGVRADGTTWESGGPSTSRDGGQYTWTHRVEMEVVSVSLDGDAVQQNAQPGGPWTPPWDREQLATNIARSAERPPGPVSLASAPAVGTSENAPPSPEPVSPGFLPRTGAVLVPPNPPRNWWLRVTETANPSSGQAGPGTLPGAVPSPAPLPAYVPRPVPGPDPSAPQPEPEPLPGVVPGTRPPTTPTTTPTTSPTYPAVVPVPGPGGLPLPGDGTAPNPAPVPTPTTPPATVIPWPGAPPIGGPGQAPAPTLTGIAQEVGRIERKIDVMMGPRPGGQPQEPRNWQDQLDDLMDWIERLEFGGSYELRGVCEVDANGEPVETVVDHPWPPGIGVDAGLYGRLDAIAAMIQTHKELRQPICRGPKAQGEPVTVQFEEL